LTTRSFPTPFDFFQEFGGYWEEMGWSRIGHQLEDLFRRLHQFIEHKGLADMRVIEGLMKLDYLANQKYKPRKPWWEASYEKSERSAIYQEIARNPSSLGSQFENLRLSEKDLHKHTLLDQVDFDISAYLETGEILPEASSIIAFFDASKEQTQIFSCTKHNLKPA
jgi:anaerobic magnesium-protoporphyrin IX monomethyl ester cyclase